MLNDFLSLTTKVAGCLVLTFVVSCRTNPESNAVLKLKKVRAELKFSENNNVTFVKLAGKHITDEDLRAVGELKEIKELIMSHNTQVGDEGLANLVALRKLEVVIIYGSRITDIGCKYIGKMKNLRLLRLIDTTIDDEGMAHIVDLPKLKILSIRNANITDNGVVYLGKMSQLTSLDLSGSQISNSAIARLTDMTNLESLGLNNTKVSSSALLQLSSLTKLRDLGVIGLNLTNQELDELKHGLPNTCIIDK